MAPKNISFIKEDDKSHLLIDHYFLVSKWYFYEDAYSYYDIDVNNILPYKKSDNEYVIRYIDKYRSAIAPLHTKLKHFFGDIHKLKNNITLMSTESDDKELFIKLRKIWNKIIELIGINNAKNFVKYTTDDAGEFIMVDVHKNTNFVKGSNSDEPVIVLHSVINNDLKTSVVQLKTVFSFLPIFKKFRTWIHLIIISISTQCTYTIIITCMP